MGVGAIFFTSNKVALKRRERVNREIAKRERVNKCFGGYMVIELCTKNIWVNWNDSP